MIRRRFPRWLLPATALTLALGGVVLLAGGELLSDPFDPSLAWRPDRVTAPQRTLFPPSVPLEACARQPGERRAGAAEGSGAPSDASAQPQLGLPARLAQLDASLEGLQPADALARLLEQLGGPLPGTPYEAETLRLAILARIGALPGPDADRALCAWLDAERPRPERLMAIEQLSTRRSARTHDLESIAAADHDLVVQRRARWALERLQ